MAVEALKSAMTYQEQPGVKAKGGAKTESAGMEAAQKGSPITVTETGDPPSFLEKPQEREEKTDLMAFMEQKENSQARKAAEQLSKKMQNCEALFGIHEETNRVTIKIVNKDTKEILKEFPPEKTLDMIAKAWELAGLMIDEKR